MADSGNRGGRSKRGGERGRDDRGGRGRGRGRGRGDDGAKAGPSTRGDEGERSRGGGGRGERGRGGDGRGRGRGRDESRGRGDQSHSGRGGDRGRGFDRGRGDRGRGRGGRGGRREESPGKMMAFSMRGTVPEPDAEITALEDNIMATQSSDVTQLSAKMKTMNVRSGKAPSDDSENVFPARPAFGNKGRSVIVWANYFRLNAKPVTFYKYTVTAVQVASEGEQESTKKDQKRRKGAASSAADMSSGREVKGRKLYLAIREALNQLTVNNSTVVLASEFKSQLISLKKLELDQNPLHIRLPVENKPGLIDVIAATFHGPAEAPVEGLLKYLRSMDDGPGPVSFPRYADVVDALNVVLGHQARSQLGRITAVGSARFLPFGEGEKIQNLFDDYHAIVAARGAFQSARLATGRILLNTNVTHGVFKVSGRLDEIMKGLGIMAVPKDDRRGTRKLKAFAKFLPKTRVWVTFQLSNGKQVRKSKAIHNLAMSWDFRRGVENAPRFQGGYEFGGPKNVSFWKEDASGGEYITVHDYFRQKYNKTLGNYPLVNVGSPKKPIFFPAEFVEIQPGQSVKAKLTGNETTAMLDFACRSPYANAITITSDCRETLGLDNQEELDKFGLSVDKQLLTVHARVLDAPQVTYLKMNGKQPADTRPHNGSWNLRGVKVVKPGSMIERWSFVNVYVGGRDPPVDDDVVDQFGSFMSNTMGINIRSVTPPLEKAIDSAGIDRVFEWAKEQSIQFLLVILSEEDRTGAYAKIKTLGDCTYGIQTSCVVASKFRKAQPGYFANVGLKWNLKAGGVNHRLRDDSAVLKDGKTMIVGYDVTHPTNMNVEKGNEPPSLVGLVASVDRNLGQWPAVAWEQAAKQEMLGDTLVEAFKSRLELWQKNNKGQLPTTIVIFRDGVSEGQYAQVLEKELPSIRNACRQMYTAKTQPKLAIVVSVKRHQTRFYPTDAKDMSGSGNVPNGTVVDRGVTQVRYWDFFLTAHDALKGTARPAHYTVLLDEVFRVQYGAEAANQLERLTHELCYLFGRATRAVSICPPAYYADIVCERARAHRPEYYDASDVESVTTASGPGSVAAGAGRQVHDALKDTMYYI